MKSMTRSRGPDTKRVRILAALGAALVASFAATAVPAGAAVSSASIDELTATLNLDGADDNVTVSVAGGLLVHGQTTGGLASGSDWDSGTPNNQTVPADGTRTVIVNGGDGNDSITVVAKTTEVAADRVPRRGEDEEVLDPDPRRPRREDFVFEQEVVVVFDQDPVPG